MCSDPWMYLHLCACSCVQMCVRVSEKWLSEALKAVSAENGKPQRERETAAWRCSLKMA